MDYESPIEWLVSGTGTAGTTSVTFLSGTFTFPGEPTRPQTKALRQKLADDAENESRIRRYELPPVPFWRRWAAKLFK